MQRGMVEGLRAVIVNPSVVIGEGDMNSSSSRLVAYAMHRRVFYTKGVKGYVDVRDVARARGSFGRDSASGREAIYRIGRKSVVRRFVFDGGTGLRSLASADSVGTKGADRNL